MQEDYHTTFYISASCDSRVPRGEEVLLRGVSGDRVGCLQWYIEAPVLVGVLISDLDEGSRLADHIGR